MPSSRPEIRLAERAALTAGMCSTIAQFSAVELSGSLTRAAGGLQHSTCLRVTPKARAALPASPLVAAMAAAISARVSRSLPTRNSSGLCGDVCEKIAPKDAQGVEHARVGQAAEAAPLVDGGGAQREDRGYVIYRQNILRWEGELDPFRR